MTAEEDIAVGWCQEIDRMFRFLVHEGNIVNFLVFEIILYALQLAVAVSNQEDPKSSR
jgi:hypothetical protein